MTKIRRLSLQIESPEPGTHSEHDLIRDIHISCDYISSQIAFDAQGQSAESWRVSRTFCEAKKEWTDGADLHTPNSPSDWNADTPSKRRI